jgi:putative ABC transport system permease protein
VLGRLSPRQLLTGQTGDDLQELPGTRRPRWSWRIAAVAVVGAVGLAISAPWLPQGEMQAMTFFISGMLLLVTVLCVIWAMLKQSASRRPVHALATASPVLRVGFLGIRNAGRHRVRSILTTGLVASATFLLVAVQSFHRQPEKDFLNKDAGSGGCALIAETDVPVFQDLNNENARRNQLSFPTSANATLQDVTFYPFRVRPGDDISCLNLYEARRPRILGATGPFIHRGGFRFASSEARTEDQRSNPWLLLEETRPDNVIPVIADATTAEWVLHKKLGEVLEIPNERGGNPLRLRLVGLLQDSIFQSELLLSEANFLDLFPRQEGYNFFLIAAPAEKAQEVKALLQATLASRGIEVTEALDRVRSYMAVENTYLLTFQALGGLGLLLGASGLAVVLMRSVWERRAELALLQALGYRKRALGWLVLAENGFLLVLGLVGGTLAALLAVAPHLAGVGGGLPGFDIVILLTAVLLAGLLTEMLTVAAMARAPLVAALRHE